MFKLKQYYNQNRKKIWAIILFVIFLFGLLYVLNFSSKNNTKDISNSSTNRTTITATADKIQKQQTSAVNDYSISKETASENEELIKKFIEYCNNAEIQKAYNMLSSNCKEVLYPTEEEFVKNYYNNIFNEKKICDMQSWIVNGEIYTYKVTMDADILSSGQINASNQKNDFITIVNENNEKKLNINNYIRRKKVTENIIEEDIDITVNYKDIYIDYEIYNISVKNETDNIIMLDEKKDSKTVYLLDDNEIKYSGYMHEISKGLLIFKPHQKRILNIKFNKVYETEKTIKSMHFTKVITDYEEYVNDKENYEGKSHIIVGV